MSHPAPILSLGRERRASLKRQQRLLWHLGRTNIVTIKAFRPRVVHVLFLSAGRRISAPFPATSDSPHPGTSCQHASLSSDPEAGHGVAYRSSSSRSRSSGGGTPWRRCVTCRGELPCTPPSALKKRTVILHLLVRRLIGLLALHFFFFFPIFCFCLSNQPWDYRVYPPPL